MRGLTAFVVALPLLLNTSDVRATKEVTYYLTDNLGTVLAVTDASGNVLSVTEHTPYGIPIPQVTGNGVGFAGHIEDDESDMVYMQARYFDPQAARFVSIDPSPGVSGNLFKFNRYMYVSGNPFYASDPDGLDECSFACRRLRALSDHMSGIGMSLNESSGSGSQGPLGRMSASTSMVQGQSYEDLAGGLDAISGVADAAVSAAPGGDLAVCTFGSDSCGSLGWGSAIIGLLPAEGLAREGLQVAGGAIRFADFNMARNAALRWLEARGFRAMQPVLNRFPKDVRGTQVIGYATEGNRVGYRVEFDGKHGAHINVWSHDSKEKANLLFEGDQNTVNSITKGLGR